MSSLVTALEGMLSLPRTSNRDMLLALLVFLEVHCQHRVQSMTNLDDAAFECVDGGDCFVAHCTQCVVAVRACARVVVRGGVDGENVCYDAVLRGGARQSDQGNGARGQ